jgi:hypothetical protein
MFLSFCKRLLGIFAVVLVLTSCSSINPEINSTSVETIVPGKTECGMPGDISPDGKYICVGHGAYYWRLRSEVSESNSGSTSTSGHYVQECTTRNNPGVVPGTGNGSGYLPPEVITTCKDVWLSDDK